MLTTRSCSKTQNTSHNPPGHSSLSPCTLRNTMGPKNYSRWMGEPKTIAATGCRIVIPNAMSLFAWSTIKPNSKGCEDNLSKLLEKRSPARPTGAPPGLTLGHSLPWAPMPKRTDTSQEDIELLVETSNGTEKIIIPKNKFFPHPEIPSGERVHTPRFIK